MAIVRLLVSLSGHEGSFAPGDHMTVNDETHDGMILHGYAESVEAPAPAKPAKPAKAKAEPVAEPVLAPEVDAPAAPVAPEVDPDAPVEPVAKKRGRPVGSKNRAVEAAPDETR